MSEHIPAWKRLGLKLKYAKEQPDSTELSLFQGSNKKRADAGQSHTNASQHTERPTKRRRIISNESGKPTDSQRHVNGQNDHEASRHASQEEPTSEAVSVSNLQRTETNEDKNRRKKRKSVSFTNDTKIDDGDSRVTIDFPAGSPGSTPKKAKQRETNDEATTAESPLPAEDVSSIGGQTEDSSPSDTILPQRQKIKQKTAKQKGQKSDSVQKSVAALEYLEQHRSKRALWKFNKTRDIWILNNARDTEKIPRSYDLALAGYVHGLPEKAAARARLIQECKQAIPSSEQEDVSSIDATKYKEILLQQINEEEPKPHTNGGFPEWLESQPRPRLILWALGVEEESGKITNGTTETKGAKTLTPAEKKKLKKSRTAVPIDISSSSESDSESDSSDGSRTSESGENSTKKGAATKITSGDDDTSSSGTSSSFEADGTSSSDNASSESSSDSE
ncbi:hypothetical protein H2198_004790 [Neophaeococcomyces mojaviensis]|uniref:Uncharacterized protein n=1 Tax=Neophaeococcomyces mojaviensis TaxID=3383035 RepID=A0ACC3A7I5_9EURO|nr:hypothetical protein H2198_004790 [Knufia sp. JES_112]